MKMHPRHCKDLEQPCTQEHMYYCAFCSGEFNTEASTFHRLPSGINLPAKFWPVCSLRCYRQQFDNGLDSNPNGLSWTDIEIEPQPGEDPDEPIDFLDRDTENWLSGRQIESELQALEEEGLLEEAHNA